MRRILGNVRLDVISQAHIRKIQRVLLGEDDTIRVDRPRKHGYINALTHSTLRDALIDMGVEFPAQLFKHSRRSHRSSRLPKQQCNTTDYWTLEERDLIIGSAKVSWERPYLAYLKFAFFTGARIEEILALRERDVNMDRGTCRIAGKGYRLREIGLSKLAMGVLVTLPFRGPDYPLFKSPERGRRINQKSYLVVEPHHLRELRLAARTGPQAQVIRALTGGAGSVAEAAEALGIHRNTLRDRFERVAVRARLDLSPSDVLRHRVKESVTQDTPPPSDRPISLPNFRHRVWRPLIRGLADRVPQYPLRCTRHTWAFAMIDQGWKARDVARYMGNSEQMVQERYVKLRDQLSPAQVDEALRYDDEPVLTVVR